MIIIIVVVGSEVDFSGLESFILIDGFLMNIIFDEDLEKIGEEIIWLIVEGMFLCKGFLEISIWLGKNFLKLGKS